MPDAATIAAELDADQRLILRRTPRAVPLPARQIATGSISAWKVAAFVQRHPWLFDRFQRKRPNHNDVITYCLRPLGIAVRDALDREAGAARATVPATRRARTT